MAIQSDQEFAPTQIARAVFPTAFRGYDQDAVRRYLSRLASALEHQQEYAGLGELEARTPAHERVEELETEVEDLQQEIRDLELELVQRSVSGADDATAEPVVDNVPFDEHRAIELLGKETARVLESARSAAADILKRAETQAASLKSQAKSELAEARRRADSLLTEKQAETEELTARLTSEAETEAERISVEAKEHRDAVLEESSKILSEAEALSEAEQADAEERAKQIVADAETLRQQVVSELVAERREAQLDMERIKAARDRLAMSLAVARSELDEVADALVDASVNQDEQPPAVPVPVGGRSHREEVAGLIDQLEATGDRTAEQGEQGEPDEQGEGDSPEAKAGDDTENQQTEPSDLSEDGADDGNKKSAEESDGKEQPPVSGDAADNQPGAAKSGNKGSSAKKVQNSRRFGTEEIGDGTTSADAGQPVADDGGLKIGGNTGSSDSVSGAANRATDGVRASVKQKKNGRSRKSQQKSGKSAQNAQKNGPSGKASSGSNKNKRNTSPDNARDDEDLVSVIDAALSDGDGESQVATEPESGADEDIVNVFEIVSDGQGQDVGDDAEMNQLPAEGEKLSLVEGFTTIDLGDVDLRSKDGKGDGGKGEDTDLEGEGANPELMHSVVVNEPQIPEDVITTVVSRTAVGGSERTQGDLLVEQPFTGRLPKEFSARDLALTRSGPNFRRQLRRALNDDQSDVLDRLRAGRGAITAEELPSFNDQIERYHGPLRRGLAEIAQAGAKVGGQADLSHAALDNLVKQLAKYIVDRVRVPTIKIVDEDTEADRERILEPIRALYRDFRNVGLPDLSEDALYEAFAIGLYDSIEPSAPVSWVLDPRSDPDPVCDINSDRQDVIKGGTFPSGHARPLSLPGCRCLVTLADY